MNSTSASSRLECDALRLASQALAELATGPARRKTALLGELISALSARLGASGAFAAERVNPARRDGALRVIAACGETSLRHPVGEALESLGAASAAVARAIATRTPASEPATPEAPARLALPLCVREELVGLVLLEGGDELLGDGVGAALGAFAETCGALLLGYERAAARACAGEDLQRSQRHLRRSARLDGLTGLANRASTEAALEDAAARSHAAGLPLAVIVLDLDRAKALADQLGGASFDAAITATARVIHGTVRSSDWTARWGIDVFAITLLGCDAESAAVVAERLRLRIEGSAVRLWGGEEVGLTASAGVAGTPLAFESAGGLLARALRALDEAKRAGRNRVCVSRPAQT